ncbi:phage tail protein [Moorella sp. E306M]|uniref:phage tail protein n=1 Tax=Moorella sp. E306M TaxID=2572683 RepID=UPI0010FFBD6D|nr:phage tail protein [Moorella sp. E306M]GEA17734.1 hypothetical protein E306M_08680 [Moorella sp. E306M]GEA17803.1 hypothetical protein E306M_09370 [Moorella sp. E306M]
MIGSLGPVVFETSSEKLRTFDNFKRSGSGRWARHEIMHQKPKREFLGPGDEQISFTVRFDVAFGVNPADEIFVLRFLRDQGIAVPLVLNGRPVSYESLWVIETINESWTKIDNRGRLLAAEVELTLSEYVPPPPPEVTV